MHPIFKKAVAISLVWTVLFSTLIPTSFAVTTNGQSAPWTREKAEHLARKVLFAPISTKIDELAAAGSATAAVQILFPDAVGPSRAQYESEINAFVSSGTFNWWDGSSMNRLYQMRYARDPYEAKVKLFSLFEDIFSVNQSDRISYKDVKDQHDLLYANTLGNYKDMVKRILYNNWAPGDYAEGKFLDLLDQTDKRNPNENYGRELLQLFLMWEYKVGESKDTGDERNYEESDVASIARILTGFKSDATTHAVSYDPTAHNTSTGVVFLTGALSAGASFPFVSSSGTLDLGAMQDPISGNNGLADNTIDYIFAKRSDAIALFLADRMYRFYIHDKPTRAELDNFANVIANNNFDILPSVKWLLASDMMYSDTAMNSVAYKNPLELMIGTIKLLHTNSPTAIDPMILDADLLRRMNWTPYFPGSVFGREGFDENTKWFSTYTQNQWISYTSRIAYGTQTGSYQLSDLLPYTNTGITTLTDIATSTGNTFTGSLVVSTGSLTIPATGSGATGTVEFPIGASNFTVPALSLATASGVLTIKAGQYDPIGMNILVSSGSLGTGTGAIPVFSGSLSLSTANLSREITPTELFGFLETKLLSGRPLPAGVKSGITDFLYKDGDGNAIAFKPSTPAYQTTKIRSVISMILSQPEYVLNTGYDHDTTPENLAQSVLANATGKILFVELWGGYDWLHGVIPKSEYSDYIAKRTTASGGSIVIDSSHVADLGDFYLNNAIAYGSGMAPSFKSLYDANNLRIFNRVGTPKHSRDHDQAQKQIASYANTTVDDADGVYGQLIRYEPSSESTISLSGRRPNVFRGGRYINIGPSGAIFSNSFLSQKDRDVTLGTLRSVMATRTYPDRTWDLFKAAIRVDEIARISKAAGGPDGAGYGNINNLKFLRTLLANNVGKAFYMQADGGYDTHSNQLAPQSNFDPMNIPKDLNYNVGKVAENLTAFFNDVKSTQDITIVMFSEFGRTIKVNGDLGTDHGQGGGMFVLSNNQSLLNSLSSKVYGNLSLKNAKNDWLGIGIDYRSIYGKIYKSLYGVSDTAHFGSINDLSKDISTNPANVALFRREFKALNDGSLRMNIKLKVESDNFSSDKAGYILASRSKNPSDPNSVVENINSWELDNYATKSNNQYDFWRDWIPERSTYKFGYNVFTNQYAQTSYSGAFQLPDILTSSQNTVSGTGNVVLRKYDNTTVDPLGTPLVSDTNSGIVLTSVMWTGAQTVTLRSADGIEIKSTGTGNTLITGLTSSSGATKWNGGFILGELVEPSRFVSQDAKILGSNMPLSSLNIAQIAKVGADTLGVGMTLSRPVTLVVPGLQINTAYWVLRSEDGINWLPMGSGATITTDATGKISFQTSHFSYFAIGTETPAVIPTCTIQASSTSITNGTPVTLTWTTANAVTATLAPNLGSQSLNWSLQVTPPNDTGTLYKLSLTNGSATGSCQVVVTAVGITQNNGGNNGGWNNNGGGSSNSGGGGGGGGSPGSIIVNTPFTTDICPTGDRSGSFYDGRCDTMWTLAQVVTTPPIPGTPTQSTPPAQPATQSTVLSATDVLAGNLGFTDDMLTTEWKTALDSLYESYLAAAQKKTVGTKVTLYWALSLTIRSLDLQIARATSARSKLALSYIRSRLSEAQNQNKPPVIETVITKDTPNRTDATLPTKKPDLTPKPPKPKPTVQIVSPSNQSIPAPVDAAPVAVNYTLPAYATTYTSADFENYDWFADRRFAPSIFGPIDANIEKIRADIVSKWVRTTPYYESLLADINAQLQKPHTTREQKILLYIRSEITIIYELSKRPR